MLYCRIVLNCVCLLLYVWRIFNELSHNYICMTYIVLDWDAIYTIMFELCEILTQLSYCIVLYVWRCAICICLTYRLVACYNALKWTFIWWRYKCMAYSTASGKAVLKYDKEHYKKATVKIPLDVWENIQKCDRFKNANQFLNMLILEELERDGFLSEWCSIEYYVWWCG